MEDKPAPNTQTLCKLPNLDPKLKMKFLAFLLAVTGASAAVTTTLPKSAGSTAVPTAIPVSGSYDGGMKKFDRNRK